MPLQGLAHTKHRTLFCFAHSYHTISSFFLRIGKKKKKENLTAFWFEATKTKKRADAVPKKILTCH